MSNNSSLKICLCGGGSLGHVLATILSSKGHTVNLLSGRPDKWSQKVIVNAPANKRITGDIAKISDNPQLVVKDADIVLLCVPGYLITETLQKIKPFLTPHAYIGTVVCSNGFFWIARHILGENVSLFGFQRVPYICRVKEYGKEADLKGYKSSLRIAGNKNIPIDTLCSFFEQALDTPVFPLKHYLEATLTNSNPLLHPARIYGILQYIQDTGTEKEILFYEDWDNISSQTLIDCDNEFQSLLKLLPVDKDEIPPILPYYDSYDQNSLTLKMQSIEAFKGIKMSMVKESGKYFIDYSNRYFTEDIPFGLLIIKSIAVLLYQPTPTIDKIIYCLQEKMNKEYIIQNQLTGKDLFHSGIIQNFNIHTVEQLIHL